MKKSLTYLSIIAVVSFLFSCRAANLKSDNKRNQQIIDSLNIEKAFAQRQLDSANDYFNREKECGNIAVTFREQYYKTGDRQFGILYNKYADSVRYWASKIHSIKTNK